MINIYNDLLLYASIIVLSVCLVIAGRDIKHAIKIRKEYDREIRRYTKRSKNTIRPPKGSSTPKRTEAQDHLEKRRKELEARAAELAAEGEKLIKEAEGRYKKTVNRYKKQNYNIESPYIIPNYKLNKKYVQKD